MTNRSTGLNSSPTGLTPNVSRIRGLFCELAVVCCELSRKFLPERHDKDDEDDDYDKDDRVRHSATNVVCVYHNNDGFSESQRRPERPS